jgi:hypothetical protein
MGSSLFNVSYVDFLITSQIGSLVTILCICLVFLVKPVSSASVTACQPSKQLAQTFNSGVSDFYRIWRMADLNFDLLRGLTILCTRPCDSLEDIPCQLVHSLRRQANQFTHLATVQGAHKLVL